MIEYEINGIVITGYTGISYVLTIIWMGNCAMN